MLKAEMIAKYRAMSVSTDEREAVTGREMLVLLGEGDGGGEGDDPIAMLMAHIEGVKAALSALAGDVGNLGNKVAELQGDLATVKKDVEAAANASDVSTLTNRVDEIAGFLADFMLRVSALEAAPVDKTTKKS